MPCISYLDLEITFISQVRRDLFYYINFQCIVIEYKKKNSFFTQLKHSLRTRIFTVILCIYPVSITIYLVSNFNMNYGNATHDMSTYARCFSSSFNKV